MHSTQPKMNFLDFYKEQYYKELERANGISNSFATPVTIMSVLAGGLYYSLASFPLIATPFLKILFILLTSATVIFIIKSIYHLIKAIANFKTGYNYYMLAGADELGSYQSALDALNQDPKNNSKTVPKAPLLKVQNVSKNPSDQTGVILERVNEKDSIDFSKYLTEAFIACNAQNQKNNDIKLYQRFLCIRYLTMAIITICFLIIPLSNKKTETTAEKIEVSVPPNCTLEVKQD